MLELDKQSLDVHYSVEMIKMVSDTEIDFWISISFN